MRTLDLQGMAPGPNTSRAHPQHKVYPYLLRGVAIERPNQVWSTDITYIRFARGFAYLAGGHHRLVFTQSASWRTSVSVRLAMARSESLSRTCMRLILPKSSMVITLFAPA